MSSCHTSPFFKLFPPPKFMMMTHAGLDISDDAIHFIEYSGSGNGRKIKKYGRVALPEGLIDGGDVKDEKKLGDILSVISREHGLSYAKVSIPEEKAYLFETDVPSADARTISPEHRVQIGRKCTAFGGRCGFCFRSSASGKKAKHGVRASLRYRRTI